MEGVVDALAPFVRPPTNGAEYDGVASGGRTGTGAAPGGMYDPLLNAGCRENGLS